MTVNMTTSTSNNLNVPPTIDAATAASLEEIEQEIVRMQQKIKEQQQQQQVQQQQQQSPAISLSPRRVVVAQSSSTTNNNNNNINNNLQPIPSVETKSVVVTPTIDGSRSRSTTNNNVPSSSVSALSASALELRREIEEMEAEILRAGGNRNSSYTRKSRQQQQQRQQKQSNRTTTTTTTSSTVGKSPQSKQKRTPAGSDSGSSTSNYNNSMNHINVSCDTASTASGSSNATPLASNNASYRSFGGTGIPTTMKIPQSISTVDEYDDMISTHPEEEGEEIEAVTNRNGNSGNNFNQSCSSSSAKQQQEQNLFDERSQIEEEIRRMEESISRIGTVGVAGAAIVPSVASPKRSPTKQQQSPSQKPTLSLGNMVSQRAKEREERLALGGEKVMTNVKPKEVYKQEFTNVAIDAANLGRLTRLNEHTIESVAIEKAPVQEWKSGGLLSISWNQQPSHISVIQEAAQLGALTKKQETVVSNYDKDNDNDDYAFTHDERYDEYDEYNESAANNATHYDKLLELDAQAGTGFEKVDTLIMGLKEESVPTAGDNRLLVRPMYCYQVQSVEEVQLPKPLPPRIDPIRNKEKLILQQKQMMVLLGENSSHYRPMTDIGHTVAEIAWERRTRLDRPGSLPRVQERCPCQYCVNPSPYQTYAYKLLEQRLIASGEWQTMKRPLRIDDPRVTQLAQTAQQQYTTPSDLPTNTYSDGDDYDDQYLQQNGNDIDYELQQQQQQQRAYDNNQRLVQEQQQQQKQHKAVVSYEYSKEEEVDQQQPESISDQQYKPILIQKPPQQSSPKKKNKPNKDYDIPVPQPQDAKCCACVIM